MNYGYRINLIKKELENLLSSYSIPMHLRHDEDVKAKEIEIISKALNQLFPNDCNQEIISGAFERAELKIKAAHMSRSWPKASDIATAIKVSIASDSEASGVSATWYPDPKVINANRIKRGEPVSEFYINGKLGEELINDGLITEHDLQPYKEYLAVEKIDRI